MNKKISFFSLALMMTGSVDSIRNLPSTALFGASSIFYIMIAAMIFLIPTALISAQLTSRYAAEAEGVYGWVKKALGNKVAFMAIWFQWVNTLIWYPAMLSFIASTLFYLIDPNLINSKAAIATTILITYWSLTLINLKGIKLSIKFASVCTAFGMIIPMALIILLGIFYLLFHTNKVAIDLTYHSIIPNFDSFKNITAITAIVTSFLGMELATVHVKKVHNPQKNFPKAIFLTAIFIILSMTFGALAIAIVIPSSEISLVGGVIQSFSYFLSQYHLSFLLKFLISMILIGSLGGIINWIISPAQGLLQAAEDNFLPKWSKKLNKYDVPVNILWLQAIIVTIICVTFIYMPSVNGSYWFLSSLSTQLYLIMYMLMFISAIVLENTYIKIKNPIYICKIMKSSIATYTVATFGLVGVIMSLFIGFIPPSNIDIGNNESYELAYIFAITISILPIFLFYNNQKKSLILSN
jgi:glutamate:GABA antiporter